ncbi:hypothetical protein QR685DRAFT_572399 [Neurospora intermedia]|uniref:Uncharacterized protein n=1 Tax=Neurospora intermedia TaxID=5142 RepID=A0ABR3D9M0_NEUIN
MSLPPSMPPSRTRCGQLMELMSTDEHTSKVCGRNLVTIVGCSVTYLLLPTVGYTRNVMFQSQRPLNLYAGHVKCNV